KCLEKEPHQRYASAEALAAELRRFLNDEPIHARPLSRPARLARGCRRDPARAWASGLAALALVATVVVSTWFGIAQTRAAARLRLALTDTGRLSASLAVDRGLSLCEQGDLEHGLLWLGHSLELATQVDDAKLERVIRANLAGWHRRLHPLHGCLEHDAWVTAVAF